MMPDNNKPKSTHKNQIILLVAAAIALYVILPQLNMFRDSLAIVKGATPLFIGIATLSAMLTFVAAATNYWLLALKPLRYFRTILAQVAVMFVNRLLPGGIGGIGANYVYLRKQHHSLPQAASVVTMNNALGIGGHILLLIALVGLFYDQLPHLRLAPPSHWALVLVTIPIVLVCIYLLFARNSLLRIKLGQIGRQLLVYRKRKWRVIGALGSSVLLTLLNVVALWLCVMALSVDLTFISVLLVFSLAVVVGNFTPTPGGIGGFEAGLVAGMLAYGISGSTALAVALTYRLITYWLSLALGSVAFVVCRNKNIL